MKKIFCLLSIMIISVSMLSAQKYFDKVKISTKQDSLIYSLGYYFANTFSEEQLPIDANIIGKAFKDVKEDKTIMSFEDVRRIISNYLEEKEEQQKQEQLSLAKDFFDKNAKEEGVVTLESGLQYKIIKEGDGVMPTDSDGVKIFYEGKLINGETFESNFDEEEPAELYLTDIISGLSEGIKLMKEGSEFIFYIPYDLAYGEQEAGEIPAYSALIFDIELKTVEIGANKTDSEFDIEDINLDD
ncbi:MAG: FKBP-type peptidyl-prolyl cis-trans isomerase [Bacteroidales bacterium]|nr:FKBP-type peptidyl-prolyl cis-trans isomerase [Bacteroidales bacterium]